MTSVEWCVPFGTPTLWFLFHAHLFFELGFLIDEVFFATPVIIAFLLVLIVGASDGGRIGVSADHWRTMGRWGIETRRVVNALQWHFLVLRHGNTSGLFVSLAQVYAGSIGWRLEVSKRAGI